MKLKSVNIRFENGKVVSIDLSPSKKYDWNSHLIEDGVVKNALIYGVTDSCVTEFDIPLSINGYPSDFKMTFIGDDGREFGFILNKDRKEGIGVVREFLSGVHRFDLMDSHQMERTWNAFSDKSKLDSTSIDGFTEFMQRFWSFDGVSHYVGMDYDYIEKFVPRNVMPIMLYYAWKNSLPNNKSLLLLNFPDAFLDFKSSRILFEDLNTLGVQTIMTTNNVTLLDNDITRPDCCFIATKDSIRSLDKSTDREIRRPHNLEKMYVNGVFG